MTAVVERRPVSAEAGDVVYDFSLWIRPDPASADLSGPNLRLISPTGEQFDRSASPLGETALENDVPADRVDARFAGNWIFEEEFSDGSIARYEFTVPGILNSSAFPSPPVVTSPAAGAAVGREFDLLWDPPADGGPGFGFSFGVSGGPQPPTPGSRPIFTPTQRELGAVAMSATGDVRGYEFSAVVTSDGPALNLGPVTSLTPNGRAGFDQLKMTFRTASVPVNFTIVPEPTAMAGLAIGAMFVFAGRKGRKAGRTR